MNCTGSCSWKIYVKGGIVTWETQLADYPRTRPDVPNHELVRSALIKLWRERRASLEPVQAWQSIEHSPAGDRVCVRCAGVRARRGLRVPHGVDLQVGGR
ncbi:nitrate reductase alpha subunit [Paraburkholderia sp. JPY158]|uniref:Nitrate reductase alpha subunit n=1 Tax=Paraburkholderia atlantica TaxID=2654982 RepID=A0A7W8Q242_PARAM|nr:nitrate reductase alpha subunit [Paraburkholderia atlantica]